MQGFTNRILTGSSLTLTGNVIIGGTLSLGGDTAQGHLNSGTYVPSGTSDNGTITPGTCSWIRIGNIVNVAVTFVADAASGAGALAHMTLTLPIACNSTPTLGGCAAPSTDASAQVGTFTGGSATVANLYSAVYETDSITWGGSFQYVVN